MKDLFTGSLGRLDNHGGSRIFTTPNTREVKPDYEIATDVPSIAEFVTCSLDGRLWIFRRSRRYYIAAFRWDKDTEKLVFVSTTILSNTNFIGRGIDWLLTDNTIIRAVDDEPYIITANLFSDNGTSFLYSVLRSKDVTYAWGVSETSGNSEGYGYFYRSALLQSVNKHYSLLPAVGDWNIIGNFLLRRFVNPTAEDEDKEYSNPYDEPHNSMLNLRPLIPLEFNGSTPIYGCGFDKDIFITHFNGELWGRGLSHIGRCYILPAVFDEEGNPQEFYLYISPDYPRIAVTQADKLNLGILKTADNLYGFLTAQVSSLDNNLCYSSDNPKLFQPSTKQWQQISESGQMFIDTLNHSSVVLSEDSAKFIDGSSYECKGINQWLAPAGIVDAVSTQYVISSVDNATIATYHQQEFHRELLASKKIPISAKGFSGKRLSLGITNNNSRKKIQVNSNNDSNSAENISWGNIYKQPLEIRQINSFSHDVDGVFGLGLWPAFYYDSIQENMLPFDLSNDGYSVKTYTDTSTGRKYFYTLFINRWYEDGILHSKSWYEKTRLGYSYGWATDTWGNSYWEIPGAANYYCYPTIFYIDPDSGQYYERTISTNFNNTHSYTQIEDDPKSLVYVFDSEENSSTSADVPLEITVQNGQIGYTYIHSTANWPFSNEDCHSEILFRPLCAVSDIIPDSIQNWQNSSLGCLSLQSFHFPKNIPKNITCPASAVFSEKYSNAKFLHEIPSVFKHSNGNTSGNLASYLENDDLYLMYHNYWNINSLDDSGTYSVQGLHVAIANDVKFFVFRSELHPDIFDFKAESERSKLS